MAVNLSIQQTIIITLSLIAVILGIVLIVQISKIKEIIPFNQEKLKEKLSVDVAPKSSQQGTVFLLKAETQEIREQQHVSLVIEKDYFTKENITLYDDGLHNDKQANDGLYAGIFDSSNYPVGDYKIKSNEEILNSFKIYKPNCEAVIGIPDKSKINFVILPENYADYNEFRKDAILILDGSPSSLLEQEPFKSSRDKLSFVIVNSSRDLECDIGCKGFTSSVCCNNLLVAQEASQCDASNIIVLINDERLCGMASSYAKICAKNRFADSALVHELGHTFGDLADEYVYNEVYPSYTSDGPEVKNANCDFEKCLKWNNVTSDCFKGCTSSNFYRPSENSIMRDLSSPKYNLVSQIHITNLIKSSIESNSGIQNQKSYFVNVKYLNGNLTLNNVILKPIPAAITARKSDFTAEIKDAKQNSLFKTKVYLPIIDNFQYPEGPPIINAEFESQIILPYSPDANDLEISKNNIVLASASLALFSKTCGNNICDNSENHLNCPSDCEIDKDNFCEAALCDSNCPNQKNCKIGRQNYALPMIIIILGLIGIIASVVYKKKK